MHCEYIEHKVSTRSGSDGVRFEPTQSEFEALPGRYRFWISRPTVQTPSYGVRFKLTQLILSVTRSLPLPVLN